MLFMKWVKSFWSWVLFLPLVWSASKDKVHSHQGVLEPFDGKPLPWNISPEQEIKLNIGESVMVNERTGKSGRGIVIQDIDASPVICMDKILDLKNYPKFVPHLKSVDIYDQLVHSNGTSKIGAKFDVSLLGMKIGYFLKLTHEPTYNTLTWTLDYSRNSDFDDNVGHWQVAAHPRKDGWTRLLYSTKVKLFPWVPEFVVKFLTNKALSDSTAWVKRESELQARIQSKQVADAIAKQQAEKQKQLADSLAATASKVAEASKQSACNHECCLSSWFRRLKGGAVWNKNIAFMGQKLTGNICTLNLCKFRRGL